MAQFHVKAKIIQHDRLLLVVKLEKFFASFLKSLQYYGRLPPNSVNPQKRINIIKPKPDLNIFIIQRLQSKRVSMNSEQFSILLNKLEKLKMQREREQSAPSKKHQSDRSKSKKLPSNNLKYPNDIAKYEVVQTLGAGTFGRVKQVISPSKEVLALKQLSKSHIINLKQVEHIKLQKKILMELNHPFIYSLKTSFQDDCFIYMIFQYCSGGQLFNRLRKDGRFSNDVALFYICEILLAFCHMHSKNIIYRDLKPENLLIDREGHVKIADFGFAKKLINDRTFTLCGTPQYLAPEIIMGSKQGYGKSSDWWALGILVYQLLTGHPPFYDMKPLGIYQKILKGIIEFPAFLSLRAKDLIRKLLNPQVKYRIGVVDNGQSVKNHKWFKGVDWEMVFQRKIPAPWVPFLRNELDASWFDKIPDTPRNQNDPISEQDQHLFADF